MTKAFVAKVLHHYPATLQNERKAVYLRLLTDRRVEPNLINAAGWYWCFAAIRLPRMPATQTVEALSQTWSATI